MLCFRLLCKCAFPQIKTINVKLKRSLAVKVTRPYSPNTIHRSKFLRKKQGDKLLQRCNNSKMLGRKLQAEYR